MHGPAASVPLKYWAFVAPALHRGLGLINSYRPRALVLFFGPHDLICWLATNAIGSNASLHGRSSSLMITHNSFLVGLAIGL